MKVKELIKHLTADDPEKEVEILTFKAKNNTIEKVYYGYSDPAFVIRPSKMED